jgi:hypothetical protein
VKSPASFVEVGATPHRSARHFSPGRNLGVQSATLVIGETVE